MRPDDKSNKMMLRVSSKGSHQPGIKQGRSESYDVFIAKLVKD